MYVCICVSIYIYVYMYMYIYVYMHVYINTYIYICVYIYTHTIVPGVQWILCLRLCLYISPCSRCKVNFVYTYSYSDYYCCGCV